MPRQPAVADQAAFPEPASAPLVPVDSLSAALASFAVWANSTANRQRLMVDADFPLRDDLSAFLLLNQLIYRGAARPTDLADAVEVTTSHISKVVARLENAGLVRRAPDPRDNRAVVVGLTDAGRDCGQRVLAVIEEYYAKLFSDWPEKDRLALTRLVVKLAHSVDRQSAHELSEVSGYDWSDGGQSL